MEKEWLFGKTLGELAEVAASFGMPRFTATQIAAWIYRKGALSIDEMTNISLKNRRALEERYQVGRIPSAAVQQSADGTKKYLFPTLRIGLHPGRPAGDAVRFVAVGLPDGLPLLHDGTPRFRA